MRQARGRRQRVLGRHKSGSLRLRQADRLRTLRAADKQVGQQPQGPRCCWQETGVEVNSAKKGLQLADVGRLRMGEHRLHMAAQGLDAGGGHLMTQELDGGGGEHALLCIDDQARLAQPRENLSQMLQMLLQ